MRALISKVEKHPLIFVITCLGSLASIVGLAGGIIKGISEERTKETLRRQTAEEKLQETSHALVEAREDAGRLREERLEVEGRIRMALS